MNIWLKKILSPDIVILMYWRLGATYEFWWRALFQLTPLWLSLCGLKMNAMHLIVTIKTEKKNRERESNGTCYLYPLFRRKTKASHTTILSSCSRFMYSSIARTVTWSLLAARMAGKVGGLLNSYMKYNYRSTVSTVKETRKRMINNGFGTPQSTESVSENFIECLTNVYLMTYY